MSFRTRERGALPLIIGVAMLVGMLVAAQVASAAFVRPKAATPFTTSLVVAHDECVAANFNSTHNPANLAGQSCKPEVKSSTIITSGDPTVNGQVANFQGNVKLVVSNPADVKFPSATAGANGLVTPATASANYQQDIRCGPGNGACAPGTAAGWTGAGTGDDYVGILLAVSSIRITDNNNETAPASGVYTDTGTVQNLNFSVPIKCNATAATTTGSFCTPLQFDNTVGGPPGGVTGANSICGNCVASGKRSNIENGQIQVFDGGPNGNPFNTTDGANTTVARQGVFIP